MDDLRLFYRGMDGVECYRIPSLLRTREGRLIAAVDARIYDCHDNPNRIDKIVRISDDDGVSWSKPIYALRMKGDDPQSGSAAIDPCMLQGPDGRIFMLFCASPAGVGLRNAQLGTGYTSTGEMLLTDKNGDQYTARRGKIFKGEHDTQVTLDEDGTLWNEEKSLGNIFCPDGQLKAHPTCYLYMIVSKDGGESWSMPQDITPQVKKEWMRFLGPGPGVGITMEEGPYSGRIIFPVYYSNAGYQLSSAAIYSDDCGKTWEMGASPNDTFPGGSRYISHDEKSLQEMQIVELPGARLRAFIRNTAPGNCIYYADSCDGGETWHAPVPLTYLQNPVCMVSAISLRQNRNHVLVSTPLSKTNRINGTVFLSFDGGLHPEKRVLITAGGFAYSCLTQLREEGQFGILYEVDNGTACTPEIRYRRFRIT